VVGRSAFVDVAGSGVTNKTGWLQVERFRCAFC